MWRIFARGKQVLNSNNLKLSSSLSKHSITIWTPLETDHKNYSQMTFLRICHPLASQKLLSSLEIFHLETQNARKNSPCTDFHRRLYILEFLVEWICALIVASAFALVCWFERSWKHALRIITLCDFDSFSTVLLWNQELCVLTPVVQSLISFNKCDMNKLNRSASVTWLIDVIFGDKARRESL